MGSSFFRLNDESISDAQWEAFVGHVKKLKAYLPNLEITDDRVIINEWKTSETLFFPRKPEPIAHKVFGAHTIMYEVTAAMFLLYAQDCAVKKPDVLFFGTDLDGQAGLSILRKCEVWNEATQKCLPVREDFQQEYDKATIAAVRAFREAWNETAIPDRGNILFRIREAAAAEIPADYPAGRMRQWVDQAAGYDTLLKMKWWVCHEENEDMGTTSQKWFLDKAEAAEYARKAARIAGQRIGAGLPIDIYGNGLYFRFEEKCAAGALETFPGLPHDRVAEASREIEQLLAAIESGDKPDVRTGLARIFDKSDLADDERLAALEGAYVKVMELEKADRKKKVIRPYTTCREEIVRSCLEAMEPVPYPAELIKIQNESERALRNIDFDEGEKLLPNGWHAKSKCLSCWNIAQFCPELDAYMEALAEEVAPFAALNYISK